MKRKTHMGFTFVVNMFFPIFIYHIHELISLGWFFLIVWWWALLLSVHAVSLKEIDFKFDEVKK